MKVIGVGGFARSGKDTFVAIAKDILQQNGYNAHRFAFADELKREVDEMMAQYGFNRTIYTDDTAIKTLNRPLLVWWGCQRRRESNGGLYWVDKLHNILAEVDEKTKGLENDRFVALITDVRFPNEVTWVKEAWQGDFIHLSRYNLTISGRQFDPAPNEEEETNDPLIRKMGKLFVEWESRSIPVGQDVMKDQYLRKKVLQALNETPTFNASLID